MSAQANRPLNWNVLGVTAGGGEKTEHQLAPGVRAREIGGRVVALTMPVFADNNMSLGTFCALWLIPGWQEILALPLDEKTAKLRDPAVREEMERAAKGTVFERLADFSNYRIGDTVAPQNKPYEGRLVTEIARERGMDPAECLIEIAAADEYKTVLWPLPVNDTDADWQAAARRVGTARTCSSAVRTPGPTSTGCWARPTRPGSWPTRSGAAACSPSSEAVQLMTDVPARLFGLRDRGRLVEGAFADIVVFDPATVDSGPARRVFDLPADSLRLTSSSTGVHRVLVNGVVTIVDGESTGALPGTLLRSGRNTDTVATH